MVYKTLRFKFKQKKKLSLSKWMHGYLIRDTLFLGNITILELSSKHRKAVVFLVRFF